MKIKSIINSEGKLQESRIDLKLEVGYGDKGKQVVQNIMVLIERLKDMETTEDVLIHFGSIYGYILCCEVSGILTEKSAGELAEVVRKLADIELARAKQAEKGSD